MTQIILFYYVLIVFFSLFLVVAIRTGIPCISDDGCPKFTYPLFVKCMFNVCEIWNLQ
uniref:Nodule-specific cysteine-rich peptide L58 n=1 Tax=Lens culinaris TaxID=3864 RepID=A0A7T8DVS7_LENCU|nr:nodule-specific cysteine-rich peptide L58 [Lens culinaris]